jgi:hypothetical protein
MRPMEVFRHLLHDTSGPDAAAHRTAVGRDDGWVVGPLVVGDERLTGLDDDVELSVVVGGGAGGLTALARRTDALRLVAAESVLRDLDDLPGNAARVVAAREALPEEVDVYVGVPAGRGFVDAVEVVEAAGLLARVDLGAARTQSVAEELSVLVEADLPFKVAGGRADAFGPYGVVALLMAVEALVDGAEPADAEALLTQVDEHRATAGLRGWDDATQARVRRRLRGVDSPDPAATLDALGRAGLL